MILNLQIIYLQKKLRSYNNRNDDNTINELNDKIQSLTNKNDTPKQENKTFLKITELMQRGTDKDIVQSSSKIKKSLESCKSKKTIKEKIRQADEIDALTLNNQFKCSEQQQTDFTLERDNAENVNTETSTEKAGNGT